VKLPRVVVTGMGTVNPLGLNVEEFWSGLLAGRSGIGPITRFDASKYQVKVDAEVKGFDPEKYMEPKVVDRNTRGVQFAIAAAREAAASAKLDMSQEVPERVGVGIACMVESDYIVRQNELINASDYAKYANDYFQKIVAQIFVRYDKILRQANALDFDDLILKTVELFRHQPDILTKYQSIFHYILVDEYQDTNFIQEEILFSLVKPENNICVVGDEDQSLYRFRGATVRNILEFPSHFSNCRQIKLTTNYRSHKEIIGKYNKFMSSINWDKFRFPKEIRPDPDTEFPDYPAIFAIWGVDEEDEAERVAHLIKFLKDNKVISDYSDVAILLKSVRLNHSGHYIEALKRHNIPYFSPRARAFFENDEIKLMIACYSLIFGFYDAEIESYPHKEYIEDSIRVLGNLITNSLQDFIRRKIKQIEDYWLDFGNPNDIEKVEKFLNENN